MNENHSSISSPELSPRELGKPSMRSFQGEREEFKAILSGIRLNIEEETDPELILKFRKKCVRKIRSLEIEPFQ